MEQTASSPSSTTQSVPTSNQPTDESVRPMNLKIVVMGNGIGKSHFVKALELGKCPPDYMVSGTNGDSISLVNLTTSTDVNLAITLYEMPSYQAINLYKDRTDDTDCVIIFFSKSCNDFYQSINFAKSLKPCPTIMVLKGVSMSDEPQRTGFGTFMVDKIPVHEIDYRNMDHILSHMTILINKWLGEGHNTTSLTYTHFDLSKNKEEKKEEKKTVRGSVPFRLHYTPEGKLDAIPVENITGDEKNQYERLMAEARERGDNVIDFVGTIKEDQITFHPVTPESKSEDERKKRDEADRKLLEDKEAELKHSLDYISKLSTGKEEDEKEKEKLIKKMEADGTVYDMATDIVLEQEEQSNERAMISEEFQVKHRPEYHNDYGRTYF